MWTSTGSISSALRSALRVNLWNRASQLGWEHITLDEGRTHLWISTDSLYLNVAFLALCTPSSISGNQPTTVPDIHVESAPIFKPPLIVFWAGEIVWVKDTGVATMNCWILDLQSSLLSRGSSILCIRRTALFRSPKYFSSLPTFFLLCTQTVTALQIFLLIRKGFVRWSFQKNMKTDVGPIYKLALRTVCLKFHNCELICRRNFSKQWKLYLWFFKTFTCKYRIITTRKKLMWRQNFQNS